MSLANISVYPFQPVSGGGEPMSPEYGINLRQHYAGLAMMGFCANPHEQFSGATFAKCAEFSIAQADALLAALEAAP